MRPRSHRIITGIAAIAASLWTYSCGEDAAPPSAGVEGDLGSLSQAICNTAMRCCNRGEINLMLGPYVDLDNCGDRQTDRSRLSAGVSIEMPALGTPSIALPNLGAVKEAADDGRVRIDARALQACLEHLGAMSCNELVEDAAPVENAACLLPEPPEETPCDADKLYIGQVPEGGRCTSPGASLECEPGLVCGGNSLLGVFGECVRPGRAGEACFSDGTCESTLYCSQLDGTCQPYREAGQTCVFADREDPIPEAGTLLVKCAEGLSCDPVTDTCVAPCQQGAACASDEECDEEQELRCIVGRCDRARVAGLPCAVAADCAEGLRCAPDPEDETLQVCQERLAIDEGCTSHEECASDFCDPVLLTCAEKVPADSACPSGLDEQCDDGVCEPEVVSCVSNDDCPLSGQCDLGTGICSGYCVALKPEGAICTEDVECASEACVIGFCRELPLALGQACGAAAQCETEFCSYDDEPVCARLPLALGTRCESDAECESEVCFGASLSNPKTCINGLDEGEACGNSGLPRCNPSKYYCNGDELPMVCAPLREAGEPCDGSHQCRGECVIRFGRKMCDATVDPTEIAICDGSDPMLVLSAVQTEETEEESP